MRHLLAVFLLIQFISNYCVAIQYEVVDLGTLGGVFSCAWGINDQGQVVGEAQTANGEWHAFLWEKSTGMQDLGTLGTGKSMAFSINNSGTIVGRYGGYPNYAFIGNKSNGIKPLLPDLYRSEAYAINNSGTAVGYYETSNNNGAAFSWNESTGFKDLGANSWAREINNTGQVVGLSFKNNGTALIWDGNLTKEICSGQAHGINDYGIVVGHRTGSSNPYNAFIYDSANGLRIIENHSRQSSAHAINNAGVVVGTALNSHLDRDYDFDAFVWDEQNGLRYLDTLVDYSNTPDKNWAFCSAMAINEFGQIVGGGWHDGMVYNYSTSHAFIMTPVSEPRDSPASMEDLVLMIERWLASDCDWLNAWCDDEDWNRDGDVNFIDFGLLSNQWLKGTL